MEVFCDQNLKIRVLNVEIRCSCCVIKLFIVKIVVLLGDTEQNSRVPMMSSISKE
jgi:hypothetical protein